MRLIADFRTVLVRVAWEGSVDPTPPIGTQIRLSNVVVLADKLGVEHISEDHLEEYLLHQLVDEQAAILEEHLLTCGLCRMRLESTETFIAEMRATLGKGSHRKSAVRNGVVPLHRCRKRTG
jgi:hypothetical protein